MASKPIQAYNNRSGSPPESRRRRVLLLADPELTSVLKDWLGRRGFDVHDGREAVTDPSGAEGCGWLTSVLFPTGQVIPELPPIGDRLRQFLTQDVLDALKALGRTESRKGEKQTREESATLFRWGEFDIVILQDLWLASEENVGPIALGCVLASDDYYLRGNFSSRKIVLMTDPGFFNKATPETTPAAALASMFDENGQIVFLCLVGDSGQEGLPLQRLERALDSEPNKEYTYFKPQVDDVNDSLINYRDFLRNGALRMLMIRLGQYISERADVVLVDDDPGTIESLYKCLSCSRSQSEWPELKTGGVLVLSLSSQEPPECFSSFAALVERCKQLLGDARTRSRKDTLFVTDILFDRVEWTQGHQRRTGIELIEALRDESQVSQQCVGIVAFTGLSTPFVTTPAYQRGADAIVFKSADSGSTGHAHLLPGKAGIDRLFLMLAFLCFQKQFLREKRQAGHRNARRELEHLHQVLPRHSVSPHIQEEWDDTCYILTGLLNYPTASLPSEFEVIRREINSKYDE